MPETPFEDDNGEEPPPEPAEERYVPECACQGGGRSLPENVRREILVDFLVLYLQLTSEQSRELSRALDFYWKLYDEFGEVGV